MDQDGLVTPTLVYEKVRSYGTYIVKIQSR